MNDDRPAPARRGFFGRGLHWPVLVTLLFVGNIGLASAVLVIANNDPGFAVEDDYYDKALRWDETIEQRERNDALGWSIAPPAEARADADGTCWIELSLAGPDGAPIDGAILRAVAFADARASDRRELEFNGAGDGRYAAPVPAARPGRWTLRLVAERDGDRFTAEAALVVVGAE